MKTVLKLFALVTLFYPVIVLPHERQSVNEISVLFGGEPEPVLDGEREYLRWRFEDTKTKEPVTDLEELRATIKFDGKEFGPFEARGTPREPGMYQTSHIFTKPGEGEVTLVYKRKGNDKISSVTFTLKVQSREAYHIP